MKSMHGVLHPEGTLREIDTVATLDSETFVRRFRKPAIPIKLREQLRDSVAMQTWDIQYLRQRLPDATVKLDVGNAVNTPGLTFVKHSLHGYLDSIIEGHPQPEEGARYLAAYNLFKLVPALADDISFDIMTETSVHTSTLGWVGPTATLTGYHYDLGDNLLAQIRGTKLVKLVSPDQGKHMYRARKYDPNGALSSVNADEWDAEAHPDFASVEAQYTVLEPGETLFIPAGWWHHVRSLEPSVNVNCFGYTWRQLAFNKTRDKLRRAMHNTHLYGTECTCHMTVDGKRVPSA